MKTVQDFLREADDKELADAYFAEFPIEYAMIANKAMTLKEIQIQSRTQFLKFVYNMREITVNPGNCVFFACEYHAEGHTHIRATMCELEEVRSQSSPQTYSCLLSDFASVLGNFIGETEKTKKNILIVLAQILYEMSFFGYTQEEMEKEREKLEEAANEDGKGISLDEMGKKFGWEPPGEEERNLSLDITKAEYALNQFYFHREIEKLRKLSDFQV